MIFRNIFHAAAILFLSIIVNVAHAQDPAELPRVLRIGNLEIQQNDSTLETLRKKSFNATRKEIQARINLWSQQGASIDGVIDAVERFHRLRLDVEAMPDETVHASDRVAAAKYLLRKRESLKPGTALLKQTDLIILESYQLRCEMDAELIKLGKN